VAGLRGGCISDSLKVYTIYLGVYMLADYMDMAVGHRKSKSYRDQERQLDGSCREVNCWRW
jgi:hypothetical protein